MKTVCSLFAVVVILPGMGSAQGPPTDREALLELHAELIRAHVENRRDLREPIVRISEDGSLGWLIAEVEVVGTTTTSLGPQPFEDVWAWVELYERTEDGWRLVGNASNRR